MHYRDYEPEDFLLERSFCNYCLRTDEEDVAFWESWIIENPDKNELVKQAKELFFMLNGNLSANQFEKDRDVFRAALEKHTGKFEKTETNNPPKNVRQIILITSLAAASLLAFIFIPSFFKTASRDAVAALEYEYTKSSKTGERKSFQLPDGSKVILNAGSTITIARNYNETSREITLEGEAFFDVRHDEQKPFLIHTATMDVKVLGTTFNVKAYPNDKITETSLVKGSVEVTLKKGLQKKIILHPNEKIVLNTSDEMNTAEEKKPGKQDTGSPDYNITRLTYMDSSMVETSWTQNKLIFSDSRLEEIAVALERWYSVSISFENEAVKNYRYTGSFDQKSITQVLDALQLSAYFNYKIEQNNKIIIGD